MEGSQGKLKSHPDVVFTQLSDGEAVLLNLHSKLYYSLNGTGSFLWQLLEKEESVSENEMVSKLSRHYQIPSPRAKTDVKDFLKDLSGEGLIEGSS